MTLRQVFSEFIDRRYSQSCRYFRSNFVNCCPPPLLSGSTHPPSPFSVWISILYTYTVCKGEGYGVLGPWQINTCRKVPLQVNFLYVDIFHCLVRVLSFYVHTIFEKSYLCATTYIEDRGGDRNLKHNKIILVLVAKKNTLKSFLQVTV